MSKREDPLLTDPDLAERMKQAMQRPLPKRFYDEVTLAQSGALFAVLLDGRPVKTPGKLALALPTQQLAEAVAAEWREQEDVIDPAKMPLTRLVNTVIDRVGPARAQIIEEIVSYAGSDMLCYRAEGPEGLVKRQNEAWNPVLAWAEKELSARMVLVEGVMPVGQLPESLSRIKQLVEKFDDFALGAVASLTNLTGSALLAFAVAGSHLSPEGAWMAAHVDEDWQISQWGEDAEAMRRRALRRLDMVAATDLLHLVPGWRPA